MKTLVIEIPEETVNELQRCEFEINARQGVIDRYLDKHMKDNDSSAIESKPFKHFMSLLAEAEAEFELAKNKVTEEFLPEYLKGHECDWIVDYTTKNMTITVKCNCDIPELNN